MRRCHTPTAQPAHASTTPAAALTLALASLTLAPLGPAQAQSATDRPDGLFPEPRLVSDAWKLDFDFEKPRAIAVRNTQGEYTWYWYLKYEITNDSDATRYFAPEFTIVTDKGHIFPANFNIPATVFEAIKTRHGHPLLESPTQVIGEVLVGRDFAKESVAIWPAVPPTAQTNDAGDQTEAIEGEDDTGADASTDVEPQPVDIDALSIFVEGLSGEVARFENPITGQTLLLRRTLQLDFAMPGNPPTPQQQVVHFLRRDEVMR